MFVLREWAQDVSGAFSDLLLSLANLYLGGPRTIAFLVDDLVLVCVLHG